MKADLKHVSSWLIANKLTLNVIKTVYMVVGSRQRLATLEGDLKLQIDGTSLRRVQVTKCLGVQNGRKSYMGKTRRVYYSENCV